MSNLNKQFLIFLGRRIRQMREDRKMTQDQLGIKLKMHRTYVGMVERGEKNISVFNLNRFAEAFGVKTKELIDF